MPLSDGPKTIGSRFQGSRVPGFQGSGFQGSGFQGSGFRVLRSAFCVQGFNGSPVTIGLLRRSKVATICAEKISASRV
jgi:hypothetical protein